jgi:hypothetical protein
MVRSDWERKLDQKATGRKERVHVTCVSALRQFFVPRIKDESREDETHLTRYGGDLRGYVFYSRFRTDNAHVLTTHYGLLK